MKIIYISIIAAVCIALSQAAYADAASDTIALVKKAKADCLNCHQINKKIVGPSWKDVATKYKGDPTAHDALVDKVIKGSRGQWSDQTGGLPMTPHPVRPTKEEIDQIIAAILKL
jgi:cytochrome c